MKKSLVFIVFLSCFSFWGQDIPFKIRYEDFLAGDIEIIGNTIVGRKTFFDSPNKPYNEIGSNAKVNDQHEMHYINIENVETIFSSSSASFQKEAPKAMKIRYAGIYWSATYPYAQGRLKKKETYEVVDARKYDVNTILLKLPNTTNYVPVNGEIIYAGKSAEEEILPYVAYADITTLISQLDSPVGEYTIANVYSAIGQISGGVSAGWVIVFVYEDEAIPFQKIVTYDGFIPVSKEKKVITFKDFYTASEGEVKAKLLGFALEGDLSMTGDQIFFYTNEEKKEPLFSKVRAKQNFFNSSVTKNGEYVLSRNPNSINTLGFDLFELSIPNKENSLLPNNTSRAFVEVTSKSDRYSIPFLAFAVESQEKVMAPSREVKKEEKEKIIEKPTEILPEKKAVATNSVKIQTLIANNVEKGYYTISGAFSSKKNADNFLQFLNEKGFDAKYFYNETRNLYYIYLSKSETLEEALINREKFTEKGKDYDQNLREIWILTIQHTDKN